ncbi:hypothetical protein [Fontivita pretiosa]|uniref:hypothetical protein n=1 Tax=Fontivita pretiosa TaxID=2989684 RepID=UPI003D18337B
MAHPSGRAQLVSLLTRLGFDCGECDDPYTAMLELVRRRSVYSALVLSLAGTYREELPLIATVKRRFPQVEVWLAQTDGRPAALVEALRHGADGLIDEEGLHRIAAPAAGQVPVPPAPMLLSHEPPPVRQHPGHMHATTAAPCEHDAQSPTEPTESIGEPVLSAEELRALLQDPCGDDSAIRQPQQD